MILLSSWLKEIGGEKSKFLINSIEYKANMKYNKHGGVSYAD